MNYISVNNGIISGNPYKDLLVFKTQDGQEITGFNRLSDAEKREHGVFPYINNAPAINSDFQSLGVKTLTIEGENVVANYEVNTLTVAELIGMKTSQIHSHAIELLNSQALGYSLIQIAAWPLIQAEVKAYNADNTLIGEAMQQSMAESGVTGAELSAIVTPKISYKDAVYSSRNSHVANISALNVTTEVSTQEEIGAVLLSIADYDTDAGWPV